MTSALLKSATMPLVMLQIFMDKRTAGPERVLHGHHHFGSARGPKICSKVITKYSTEVR